MIIFVKMTTDMKRLILLLAAAILIASCANNEPKELYIPKSTVEFAGNAFSAFSLGSDVKLYTAQSPDQESQWTVQAVVPVRKETQTQLETLDIQIVPLDERNIRVREGLVLEGEDLSALVPVFNSGKSVERTVVFSVNPSYGKKYFTKKEAEALVAKTKGVRVDFNAVEAVPVTAKPAAAAALVNEETGEVFPLTVDGLCRKYGVYGLLGQYERYLKAGDKKQAKKIEDKLWTIEKKVKADKSLSESLRSSFKDYVEDKEDEIESRAK